MTVTMVLILSTVINIFFLYKLYQQEKKIGLLEFNSNSLLKALMFLKKNNGNFDKLEFEIENEAEVE